MASSEHASGERGPRRGLVVNVNDNEAARYMTTLMLQKAGFQVLEASDGLSALQLAERLPDVMVLDVRLPDIDGFEVCRRIRANTSTERIKILHTSATYVTPEKKVLGLALGADGYLAQPFEAEELVATVQSLVRLSRAEHGLRERAEQLVEADKRKDEFLAMLAHELRNPLSAISASLPLLFAGEPRDADEQRARAIVQRQALHLSKLVDDLLDVARVTQGRVTLQRTQIELNELLRRVASAVRDTKTSKRGQALQLALPSTPLHVCGDATRLEQIFTNLLDNASKYSAEGGTIRLVLQCSPDATRARVVVSDDGQGIAPEALPSIFELFAQAPVAIDRSRGGLGIGLSLVKTLVELHEGSVSAASAGVGRGSQFEVELPLVAEHPVRGGEHATPEGEPLERGPSRHVLLIEDNEDAREGLAALWRRLGHRVTTAADGFEGVRLALERQPDIAFVDLGLPELDGYEVARRIRSAESGHLPLVALTGYSSPEYRARAIEAGFDHHLVKPVDVQQVRVLLASLADTPAGDRTTERAAGR